MEIQSKHRKLTQLSKTYKHLCQVVKSEVSFITYLSILKLLKSSAASKNEKVKVRHASKLSNLGKNTHFDVSILDVDKIVVNLSSYKLSDTEVCVLSRGFSYSIPPQHLDSIDIKTSFESLYRQLHSNLPINTLGRFKHRLKSMCYSYIYGYQKHQYTNLSKAEFLAFKTLCNRSDLVFCKPDKSNGVVVIDKTDYQSKMQSILDDKKKFKLLSNDPTAKRESSLQRYLRFLKNRGSLPVDIYVRIRPCGSNPSRIYGLPKLHKKDVLMRPIVSAIGSYTYELSKYLAEILKPLTTGKYTIKDSFEFSNEILSVSDIPFM